MLKEWGPFLTYSTAALGTIFAVIAAMFWSDGYIKGLILSGKDIPPWLIKSLNEPDKPFAKVIEDTKSYQMYTMKGVAWYINLFWIGLLLGQPGCGPSVKQDCDPIINNVALLDIGAIIFELSVFFILINLYRWYIWRK